MAIGNKIGFKFEKETPIFKPMYGSFIIEFADDKEINDKIEIIGKTSKNTEIVIKDTILKLDELIKLWEEPLEKVFPCKVPVQNDKLENILSDKTCMIVSKTKFAKPRVFIPVFPGTNCEYDMAKAFEDAGGITNTEVFKNLKPNDIEESIENFAKQIENAQIIAIPGGFSAGDEPDGSR